MVVMTGKLLKEIQENKRKSGAHELLKANLHKTVNLYADSLI